MSRKTDDMTHGAVGGRLLPSFHLCSQGKNGMQRERFTKVVEEVLDSLPEEFRTRIHNIAVLDGVVGLKCRIPSFRIGLAND